MVKRIRTKVAEPTYYTPQGQVTDVERYRELTEANAYQLYVFQNKRVFIELRRIGRVIEPSEVPKEFWKHFEVNVEDIRATDCDGVPYAEPRRFKAPDSSWRFRNFLEAEKHYQTFLTQYTDSHFDAETGTLVEVDNELAPPNPDLPTLDKTSVIASEFGSW